MVWLLVLCSSHVFCLLLSGHPTGDCLYDSLLTLSKAVTRVPLVLTFPTLEVPVTGLGCH